MTEHAEANISSITAGEAVTRTKNGTFLLDVRETKEWESGHAPTAKLVPLSELIARLSEIPTDQQVLVVCHSGVRSLRAAEVLVDAGIDAVNVTGGMVAWVASGGPQTADGPQTIP